MTTFTCYLLDTRLQNQFLHTPLDGGTFLRLHIPHLNTDAIGPDSLTPVYVRSLNSSRQDCLTFLQRNFFFETDSLNNIAMLVKRIVSFLVLLLHLTCGFSFSLFSPVNYCTNATQSETCKVKQFSIMAVLSLQKIEQYFRLQNEIPVFVSRLNSPKVMIPYDYHQ